MRSRFNITLWITLFIAIIGLFFLESFQTPVSARQSIDSIPTVTGTPGGPYITVIYPEPINVRAGPHSVYYPTLCKLCLQPGETAPALGRSPGGEWIQIAFPDSPNGVGWVYAPYVDLLPKVNLPIVEPPPTATPLEAPTLNPTYLAALSQPTSTRLPTFTPPPSLVVPTYDNPASVFSNRMGWVILGIGLIGVAGLIVSSIRRR